MSRLSLRTLTGSALLIAAIGCAGDPLGTPPMNGPSAAAGAADPKTPYSVSVTSLLLAPGDAEQLVATKVANGQSVPETSVRFSSSDAAVATVSDAGLVTAVAAGNAVISVTRGAHRVDVAVTVVGCAIRPLPMGATANALRAGDCVAPNGAYIDFYSVETVPGEILEFQVTGIAGSIGYRDGVGDPFAAQSRAGVPIGYPLRMVANGGRYYVYVVGGIGATGDYTITRSAPRYPHDCESYNFVQPGASFTTPLTDANACFYEVMVPSIPEAAGKMLATHQLSIRLTEMKPYTVTISGLTGDFDAGLAVFRNYDLIASAPPGPLPSPGTRTVTFTPPVVPSSYWIEVSGGRFIDNLVTWQTQTGTYHIEISR